VFPYASLPASRVWLGGAPCAITTASGTALQCTTADNTTAGSHEVGANCFGHWCQLDRIVKRDGVNMLA
jgi:hypothetical protein